jgi:hypothetical protein
VLNQYFAHELFSLQQFELERHAHRGRLLGVAVGARRRRRRADAERRILHRRIELLRTSLENPADEQPVQVS